LKETLLRRFAADNNIGEWPLKLPFYSASCSGSPPPCPYKTNVTQIKLALDSSGNFTWQSYRSFDLPPPPAA
jgi:hypothetical protein